MANVFGNSAYTLQTKAPSFWSFSKEERFKSSRRSQDISFIVPPSTLSMRSTSMGFGSKLEVKNLIGKDSPPPGSYDIPSSFKLSKGPRLVKESFLPELKKRYVSPGPGAYNLGDTVGSGSPRYTFRVKHAAKKLPQVPAPGTYEPNFTVTEFNPNKHFKFGTDSRKLKKIIETGPGPGHYNLN